MSAVKAIYWFRTFLKQNTTINDMYHDAEEQLKILLSLQSSYCSYCLLENIFFLKCGNCMSAYYCNIECQRKHWKICHKQECRRYVVR